MLLKEIKRISDFVFNNDVSDIFGYATPEEIVMYYQYWDSFDDGMHDYVRNQVVNNMPDELFTDCETLEQIKEKELEIIRELERRVYYKSKFWMSY